MLLEEEARDSHQIQVSLLFSFLLLLSTIHFSLRLMLFFLSFFIPFTLLISVSISDSKYFSSFLLRPSFLSVIDFEMLCTPKEFSSLPSDVFRKNSTFYTTTGRKSQNDRDTDTRGSSRCQRFPLRLNSFPRFLFSPNLFMEGLPSVSHPFHFFSHERLDLSYFPSFSLSLLSCVRARTLFSLLLSYSLSSSFNLCSCPILFSCFLRFCRQRFFLLSCYVHLLTRDSSLCDLNLVLIIGRRRDHFLLLPIPCLETLLSFLILSSSHSVLLRNNCSLSILTGFSG